MSKPYDLSKSSDMRRFQADMEKSIKGETNRVLMGRTYDVTCPHCGRPIKAKPGKGTCPFCKGEIDLNLDIHF